MSLASDDAAVAATVAAQKVLLQKHSEQIQKLQLELSHSQARVATLDREILEGVHCSRCQVSELAAKHARAGASELEQLAALQQKQLQQLRQCLSESNPAASSSQPSADSQQQPAADSNRRTMVVKLRQHRLDTMFHQQRSG